MASLAKYIQRVIINIQLDRPNANNNVTHCQQNSKYVKYIHNLTKKILQKNIFYTLCLLMFSEFRLTDNN